ncbi:Palmitoyl-acyl carrier protein thioesterase chloroplastic [Bienertia sinuspersici]
MEGVKSGDETPSPPPRTFANQLPDWSMLLAAITTVFLAAEKQWMMLDWKPKRTDVLIDPFGLGRMVQDGFVFRQNFSIRSYEIGADRTASYRHVNESSAGNGIKSCKISWAFGGWLWCNSRNVQKKSNLGGYSNALSRGSLSNLGRRSSSRHVGLVHLGRMVCVVTGLFEDCSTG